MLAMREGHPSRLLAQRLERLKERTADQVLRIRNPDQTPSLRAFVETTLIRPLRLLFTESIVFGVAVMTAVAFTLIYLFWRDAPIMYNTFGFGARHSSLSFFCIGFLYDTTGGNPPY